MKSKGYNYTKLMQKLNFRVGSKFTNQKFVSGVSTKELQPKHGIFQHGSLRNVIYVHNSIAEILSIIKFLGVGVQQM